MKKILSITAIAVLTAISFSSQADGKTAYNSLGCAGCHGAGGKSTVPIYPNLNGQKAGYTVKQLKDFQSGTRKDAVMKAMALLTVGKEKAIADYLATQ